MLKCIRNEITAQRRYFPQLKSVLSIAAHTKRLKNYDAINYDSSCY